VADVRTICLVGHSGAGKTALVEAILRAGGVTTHLDASPEAKARGSSVDLNLACYQKGDQLLFFLDAPGFGEFIEETYKGLRVAETAILVVNAEKGIEVQTEQAWRMIEKFAKPALALIHRSDLPNANFAKVVSELRERFQANFAPIQWPVHTDGKFTGLIDLLEQNVLYFDGRSGPIPPDLTSTVASGREALLEALAEVNDELLTHFLEDQEIPPAEIRQALQEGIRQRVVVPVMATSTAMPQSVELFTQLVLQVTPAAAESPPPSNGLLGLVFHVASDQYLGSLAHIKLYGGTIQEGDTLVNVKRGTRERVREVLRPAGDKPQKIPQAGAGEVIILTKLGEFALGDTFAGQEGVAPLPLVKFPKPVFPRAIEPLTQADEEKMSAALRELVHTKATLGVWRDDVTKETIFAGLGDTQLTVMVDRLKNRYGTGVRLIRPKVPYKETITKVAQGQYKHKKQSGGRGQYGEVHLRVEPLERGKGFEFLDEVKGGVIPGQFIPAVEKGVVESLQEGLHKYPITDIRVAVFYGSYHDVDSSEIAFKIAASQAFKLAIQSAHPVLLEPLMKLTIHTPREFTGDIMSSLSGKRGRILGMEPEERDYERIEAEVPLAEVQDYALELKSITQGRAGFQLEFVRYQPVTSEKLTEDLLKRERRDGQ
jgi:elongation factor G